MDSLLFRFPRFLILAIFMIVALGLTALNGVGRQEDPTITNLFATITTPFPGADPARVEALVTEKIEDELKEIAEIAEINSISRTGLSSIQIELSSFIDDTRLEQVWSEIRDALADAATNLPPGVPEPEFDNDRTGAFTMISAITAAPGRDVPLSILGREAAILEDRLRLVPGTKFVRVYGEPEEEVLVTIDADEAAALGLTPDMIAAVIGAADSKVRAGRIRGERHDFLIEVEGEIDALDRIRQIALAIGPLDAVTRLGDIARVEKTVRVPAATAALTNGETAVLVASRMEDDLQVDRWTAAVQAELDAFERALPGGIEHRLLFEQNRYTEARLGEVVVNLAIGMALVTAVLFVTMGATAAAIVAVTLPITGLAALFVLERLGVTVHQMSVTGMVVALGLLVDSGIVMTDEIKRRIREGDPRRVAVAGAVRRLLAPLLASTVTTILAFTPMALLPGPAGDFVGAIALSVIVMLACSFVLAMTVTPAMGGFLLPDERPGQGARWWRDGISGAVIARTFAWSLDLALRHRILALMAALLLPVVGFASFPTLTAQFFPGVDRDQFHIELEMPSATSIELTREAVVRADAILAQDERIRNVHWVIGKSAPAFYYNILADRDGAPEFAQALVQTASTDTTELVLDELQATLDRAVPQAQIVVRGLVQGPPVAAPLEMRIVGPEVEQLRSLGEEARRRMSTLAAVTHTTADLTGGGPKLLFRLDEEKVRLAGMSLGEVAGQLEALSEGVAGGSLLDGTEELPVRVRVGDGDRRAAQTIAALGVLPAGARVRASSGDYPAIPLTALGETVLEPAKSVIARRNGERVNTVQAFIERGVLPEEVLAEFRASIDAEPLALPRGYRIEWGGDSDARGETVTNLFSTVGLVVTLSIATIVLTFNSWRLSLIAFAVTVLAAGLSILALALFRYPFGIQALIGVIGSIGVSINAAIIIMTALQEDAEARLGDLRAIRDVVVRSGRHILSTTVTTFGGFLPLILAGGGFWPPFAMAIAGGVLLSTVVSFYFVPPMFSLVTGHRREQDMIDDRQHRRARRLEGPGRVRSPASPQGVRERPTLEYG